MRVHGKNPVEYLGTKELKSKKDGSPFSVIAFGDPSTYERHEFFVPNGVNVDQFEIGDKVALAFELKRVGYNERLNLTDVLKVQANG